MIVINFHFKAEAFYNFWANFKHRDRVGWGIGGEEVGFSYMFPKKKWELFRPLNCIVVKKYFDDVFSL